MADVPAQVQDLRPHRFFVASPLVEYIVWNDTDNAFQFVGEMAEWIEENEVKTYLDHWGGAFLYVFGDDDAIAFAFRWGLTPNV